MNKQDIKSADPPAGSSIIDKPEAVYGTALFDYSAQAENQMSLIKGQKILVKKVGPKGGWTLGEGGFFPSDYIKCE